MKNEEKVSRRTFVKAVVGRAASLGIENTLEPFETLAKETNPKQKMPTRALGRTGYKVCPFSEKQQGHFRFL